MAKSCGSRADKMMEVRSYKLSEYIIYSYDGGGKLSRLMSCCCGFMPYAQSCSYLCVCKCCVLVKNITKNKQKNKQTNY